MKKIEEKYVKLTLREQILLRPDTYIGSTQNEEREYWSYIDNNIKLVKGEYNPGYIKLFDEILTNASDHAIRTGKVTYIKIIVDKDSISVENDGPGIPVVLHDKEKVYIPELIFGNLLTSENYNDSEERFVGGRNGLGGKLTAIFSKRFLVETCDGSKKYCQEFDTNLLNLNKPEIKNSKKSYTKITYFPDFEKFGLLENNDVIRGILRKRACDVAAYNTKVNIYYNDELINVKKFEDYVNLYGIEEVFYSKISDNWEIAITNGTNTQVSLVNGIATNNGGTHVTYISNYIGNEIKTLLNKKIKGCTLTLNEIKSKFMVFVCCKVANPTFETQTKETLTTKMSSEITKTFNITEVFIKKVFKSSIIETILDWYNQKQNADASKLARELNKNLSKIKVEKLIDAKGKIRSNCSICLFEGDSAAAPFREYRNAETHGAFCLRGKFVNAMDMTNSKLVENNEVLNFMAAMGLRLGEKAVSEKLRYGKILIYTDADCDGSSIAALLINFIYKYWPELFANDMVYKVDTPIVVSTHVKNKKKISFYSQTDYNEWLDTINTKEWSIKYKKGLAALKKEEYEEIILKPRMLKFTIDDKSSDSLNIWFGKDSDLRKNELLK